MKKFPILSAVFRGVVKSVPMGNVAFQAVKNVKHELENKDSIVSKEKPHDWISVITQALCVAALVYAFATKAITIEDLLGYLGYK